MVSTVKMEAVDSSETLKITRQHIPDGSDLHSHCCETLGSQRSYIFLSVHVFSLGKGWKDFDYI
jgi:hypothetical protein